MERCFVLFFVLVSPLIKISKSFLLLRAAELIKKSTRATNNKKEAEKRDQAASEQRAVFSYLHYEEIMTRAAKKHDVEALLGVSLRVDHVSSA